ncbi:diguanylate cyclase (GGDEF) domain-containing protein [Pseudomonas delhiensis]|uniref:diguanylate cyclase n=1 Tax=Pseudomonas delhiensis TaxID=366289 RepID=A0A239L347_9PSED|nr:GGDEF domain-containing protein [Pseudomonas delhiensis]SDK03216.1 diguanylate cyclase (GGDEF) domain-containing protein [Pseudomonas delhiensis]SNT24740.1 diguanylate cyclase (GGDEF) domain-containing protein [Pseudomonas delhiensis]
MSQPFPQRLRQQFRLARSLARPVATENLRRLAWLALLAVPFDLVHILVFWLNLQGSLPAYDGWRQHIILTHAVAAVLLLGLGLLAWQARQRPQATPPWYCELLALLGAAVLLGFGLVISAFDQQVTSSITPFLMGAVATALILLLRPVFATLLYVLLFIAFELAMETAQPDPQLRLSNQMGGLTICGIGLLLSQILWFSHLRNLRQRQHLRRQRKELEEKNRQLEYLAGHDPLTGLFNRRQFDQLVKQELARCDRQPMPVSLLMIDLDHFKFINDRYGHPLGDEVIRHTATLLRKHTRSSDSVARLGGEEFLLLLPDTAAPQARVIAEKLRKLLEDTPLPMKDGLLYLTASFGIAGLASGVSSTYERLYSTADQALYRAKASGRNRVEVMDAAPHGTLE